MFELFDSVSETKDVQRVLHFHDFKLAGWVLIHRGTNSQLLNCTVMVMWDDCSDPNPGSGLMWTPIRALWITRLYSCRDTSELSDALRDGAEPSSRKPNTTGRREHARCTLTLSVHLQGRGHRASQSESAPAATLLPPSAESEESCVNIRKLRVEWPLAIRWQPKDKIHNREKTTQSGKKSNTKREQLNRKMQ